jgi:hypothetical protein
MTEESLPVVVRDAIAQHPAETENFFRPTRAEVLDALLCDEGETPETITGTWVRRDDGVWVDEATGAVFAEGPDGDWVETPATPDSGD